MSKVVFCLHRSRGSARLPRFLCFSEPIGGNAEKSPAAQWADQGGELRGLLIQPQGLPGRSAQGAIGCPAGEHQPPVLQQGWEADVSNAHTSSG
jgi:hypothetical protein